jgi:uncharacterized protein YlxW (UPF0749 family)
VSVSSRAQTESLTPALLVDLVTNTLDPGYALAAARRRAWTPRRGRVERALVALGCLLAGFTLAYAYVDTHRAAPETAKVHADLVTRVRSAQSAADQLDRNAQTLGSKVDSLRSQALRGAGSLAGELQTTQLLAGTLAVTGPGVIVSLANPPVATTSAVAGRPGTTPVGANQLITDRDIRSVVNQLWAAGAEAISVNDIRLTPTSAIRFAGEAVLVDFEPINPPYLIRAVGNADRLDTGFAASGVASRYQTLASVDGIGFSFDERDKLELPASTVGTLRYAHVVGSSTPSAAPSEPPSTGASN